ncbi:hypothetical protein [Brevundimonas sp.]|uniref:hypothetical protein n=1 Tax=Brevundimonas sp. TaxID=1871086 RepID=UPI00261B7581|nr:hypothetical protein [Brevundimonas sp.]
MRKALLLLALPAAACASAQGVSSPPDLTPIITTAAPSNARLYADCLRQATEARTYARASDPTTELLVFTCSGIPARTFYEALGPRTAAAGSEFTSGVLTVRPTEPPRRDLFGVDWCSWDGAVDWRCAVSLRTGTFLTDAP